jgi:hypothetical protein
MPDESELIVEIHVPLVRVDGIPAGEFQYPWIDAVTSYLREVEEEHEVEIYDEGEEFGDFYVFAIAGASETELIAIANVVAGLRTVPAGAFAVVSDDAAASFGLGTRVELDG